MRIKNFLSGVFSIFTFYSPSKVRKYRPRFKPFIPGDLVEDKIKMLEDQNKILEDQISKKIDE